MDVNVVSCVNSEGCASCESWVQFTCGKGQRNRGPREHPTQNPLGFPNRSMLPLKAARMVAVLEEPSTVTLATSMTRLRSEEHTSELQSLAYLVCRLLLEKKNPHRAEVGEHPLLRLG